jgi:acetyl esterase
MTSASLASGGADAPGELEHFLAEIGPRWSHSVAANVREVVARYTPYLARAPKADVNVTRDIAYGDDPRQRLDVFATPGGTGKPVVLFVHGGAFVDGERNRSSEVYSNVLYYFARHGCVGINIEYRLAPEHRFPAGAEDVALALRWAVAHVEAFGGAPDSVFLMGHSAGAAHVASYAYDLRFRDTSHRNVAGVIVVSGRVRADNSKWNPNARKVEAYYGEDASVYDDVSPVTHIAADSPPTFIAFAEYENPLIDVYCLELAYRLAHTLRRAPPVMRLAGHNHTSVIAHVNTAEDRLGEGMRAFVASNRRAA